MVDNIQLQMNEYMPLRDVVFETLRQAILRGELKPGERLMEIHLAQKLGVSRTPVREAIRKLELEGLVLMIPRRGAVVAEITITDLEDVLEVRMALEELAMKLACRNITKAQMDEIRQLSDAFCRTLAKGDISACAQADMVFHEAIYTAAGNGRLMQMLSNLREQMYRYRMEYLKDRKCHPALVLEHEEMLDALAHRDEEKALSVIGRHILGQKEHIIDGLHSRE